MYQKPTDDGSVLSYSSAHPKHVYQGIAASMFHRAKTLCSEEQDRRTNINDIMNRLVENGYPRKMLKRQLKRVFHPQPRASKEWVGTVVLPYKEGTSESIRRILNKVDIRVASQKGNTLRSLLVRKKDRLPSGRTTDCVYKINCMDCPGAYIGQTARELHTRISEHRLK